MPGGVAQYLASWEQVRRYAVPRRMIEAATAARVAGDWRGACAASNVDITFDMAAITREHGSEVADRLTADLRNLAPDLVRWHLPRVLGGRSTLSTNHTFPLAAYGPAPDHGPYLMVRTPTMVDGPQRMRLAFGPAPAGGGGSWRQWWTTSRHLWHAQHTDELRERCGGGDRAPFFHRDGTPLTGAELPTGPYPDDPAGRTEWLTARCEAATGDADAHVDAFAAAGIALDVVLPAGEPWAMHDLSAAGLLDRHPFALSRLSAELRLLRAAGTNWAIPFDWRIRLLFDVSDPAAPCAHLDLMYGNVTEGYIQLNAEDIPESSWRRLPDLDLLRAGRITPEELHPLVRDALFPDRPKPDGPTGPPDPPAPTGVPVRCRGAWHEVHPTGHRAATVHTAAEEQREQALVAFGGAATGCFAVRQAWAAGTGRLPRRLHAQRQDLFLRVQHGDTAGVLALLDAGMDLAARDGRQRTVLHHLNKLDHEELLPRLLAAGLDLEARDHHQRTPLHMAVGDNGSASLVRALLDAGAAIDVIDYARWTLRDLIRRHQRKDLGYLFKALAHRADEDHHVWLSNYDEDAAERDD